MLTENLKASFGFIYMSGVLFKKSFLTSDPKEKKETELKSLIDFEENKIITLGPVFGPFFCLSVFCSLVFRNSDWFLFF